MINAVYVTQKFKKKIKSFTLGEWLNLIVIFKLIHSLGLSKFLRFLLSVYLK